MGKMLSGVEVVEGKLKLHKAGSIMFPEAGKDASTYETLIVHPAFAGIVLLIY